MRLDKDEIIYMLKTNKIVVFTVVGFIALVIVLFAVKPSDEEDAGTDVVTVSSEMKEKEKELEKYFSVIEQKDLPDSSKAHLKSLEFSLYMKDKTIDEVKYNQLIEDFIELVKFKNNFDNKYVSTIRIFVYDRKMLAEKNIFAKAYTTYLLDSLPDNAKQSDKDLVEFSDSDNVMLWEFSNKQENIPEYQKYVVKSTFNHVLNKDTIPLSDAELSYLLKIFDFNIIKQKELISTKSLADVLFWDYGLSQSTLDAKSNYNLYINTISNDFEQLTSRFLSSYNDRPMFLQGNGRNYLTSVYRNKLIVENPKLANYLINGKVSKTNLDAKKDLVNTKLSASQLASVTEEFTPYLELFIEDAKEKLQDSGLEPTNENINDYIFKNKGDVKEDKKEEKEFENPMKEDKKPDSSKEKEQEQEQEKDNKNDAFSDDNVK